MSSRADSPESGGNAMWKKSEATPPSPTPPSPTPATPIKSATTPAPSESSGTRKTRIGAGVTLKGELYGDEDVIIEGRVEGLITLKQHGVIVEESGRVDANITAATICVAGTVRGNLHGTEQVVLLKTGRVEGNIYAKSVTLETGAQFKGSIDMETVTSTASAKPYAGAKTSTSSSNTAHSVAS
jgi:cytoskeletal protein CcmA (bactofilin family)